MKIIPLKVYFFAGGLRAMASFFLKSEDPKIFVIINAIVDTGSPHTILGFDDIRKKRISPLQLDKLEDRRDPLHIGGGTLNAKILKDAEFKFAGFDTNMDILVSVEKISGGESEAVNPSILGVDFLEKNKLKFFFDASKKNAYFEVED